MQHVTHYLNLISEVAQSIDPSKIEQMATHLDDIRKKGGRLFILGVGGGAGNASHAVCDFRKLCGIEAYAPSDNVSELTARTNDEGWETVYAEWLKISKISANDAILVFSVGGGNVEKNVSVNLIRALDEAKKVGAKVLGVVGKDGGYTATIADCVVIVPPLDANLVTPISEAFQCVIWHCLASHPTVQTKATKW